MGLHECDEVRVVHGDVARGAQPERLESVGWPSPGVLFGRLTHDEEPSERNDSGANFCGHGRAAEAPGGDDLEAFPEVGAVSGQLGPLLDDLHPGQPERSDLLAQVLASAPTTFDQHHAGVGPGLGEHESRDPTTGPQVERRTGRSVELPLHHGDKAGRVPEVSVNRTRAKEPERAGPFERRP